MNKFLTSKFKCSNICLNNLLLKQQQEKKREFFNKMKLEILLVSLILICFQSVESRLYKRKFPQFKLLGKTVSRDECSQFKYFDQNVTFL